MRPVRYRPIVGVTAQLALLVALAGAVGLTPGGWLTGIAGGVITNTVLARGLTRSGACGLGPADRVTLTRATLVGAVAALEADALLRAVPAGLPLPLRLPVPAPSVPLAAPLTVLIVLVVVALVLDAVDGWVARRTRTATPLGARFDMEVDAFLILLLSVGVARSVGGWVLAIGVARYAFVAVGWLLPWMRAGLPPRYWRKVVAAVQGIVLAVVTAGVLPGPLNVALLVVALALLTESFGRDVWWLWCRHRGYSRVVLATVGAERTRGLG